MCNWLPHTSCDTCVLTSVSYMYVCVLIILYTCSKAVAHFKSLQPVGVPFSFTVKTEKKIKGTLHKCRRLILQV